MNFSGAAAWIFLGVAIALQAQAGRAFLPADLLDPDQPGHFVTGVMVHDFLRSGQTSRPMAFARCFYVRYPKVAIGHWPPVFYIAEALWFLLFGTKTMAARWLCAFIAWACALALYRRTREHLRWQHALAACALFLAFPWVRQQSWQVMSDLLLASFVFAAIGSFFDYLTERTWRQALLFAAWSSLAILTKGTGWLLLLTIVAGPLITGYKSVYAAWSYWLGIAVTCAVSAPFFVWAEMMHLGYPANVESYLYRLEVILSRSPARTAVAGGLLLVILAAAMYGLWRMKELSAGHALGALLFLWLVSQVLLLNLAPLTFDLRRYYVPSVAPAVFLLAAAVYGLERWFMSKQIRHAPLFSTLLYAGAIAAFSFTPIDASSTSAYSSAVASVPAGKGSMILVESDGAGEGAIIAAQLQRDSHRQTYMLRSTKFLSHSDWNGARYSLTYPDPVAIRDAMTKIGLTYVIVDTSEQVKPHTGLLDAALRDPGSGWEVTARIPLAAGARRGEVLVYHNESSIPTAAEVPVAPQVVQLGHEEGAQEITCAGWPN